MYVHLNALTYILMYDFLYCLCLYSDLEFLLCVHWHIDTYSNNFWNTTGIPEKIYTIMCIIEVTCTADRCMQVMYNM